MPILGLILKGFEFDTCHSRWASNSPSLHVVAQVAKALVGACTVDAEAASNRGCELGAWR